MAVAPGSEVSLEGGGRDDGEIVSFSWEIAGMPDGSSAEAPEPAGSMTAAFVPDVVGLYTLSLTVTGDVGLSASCEVSVRAVSGDGLRVELYWNPPESASDESNADLHLLHPDAPYWFHYLLDCYANNCHFGDLDWDGPGEEDDPRLDLWDFEGFGPENINIAVPVTGHTYEVGVHYYQGNGLDEADVFVKIYCGLHSESPAYEAGPVRMKDYGGGVDGNDFWKVAAVSWEGEACSVAPIDEMVLALAAMRER